MAPRKRSGRGISFIFCCFRSSDHPEITYRLRNDSSFALQTMEPALPMPPVEELDVMFTELVVSRMLFIFLFFSPFFFPFSSLSRLGFEFSGKLWCEGSIRAAVGSGSALNLELCSSLKSCQFGVVSLSH